MKFSDELERLYEAEEINLADSTYPTYKDAYTQGYLDGIERAENYIRDLEKHMTVLLKCLKRVLKIVSTLTDSIMEVLNDSISSEIHYS